MTLYDNRILESHTFPFLLQPFQLQPARRVKLHHHQFIECVWIHGGRGEHLYQGQCSLIQEGDVFVIEPGEEHGYQVTGDVLAGYNILFQPELLRAEFETLSRFSSFVDFFYVEPFLRHSNHFVKHLRLRHHEQVEMKLLVDRVEREALQQRDGYHILIKTYLIQLFIFLSRCYQDQQRRPLASLSDDQVLMHIGEFITLHHALPLTLNQVSQMSGMSPSTFKAKFKHVMGKTFLEFRNEIRLQRAKKMLAETDKKILAIAHEVGFADLSFFTSSFKHVYGIPPGAYRKQMEHDDPLRSMPHE